MADATRTVTIKLNIEPGTVTLPDLSAYRLAREDVSKLNTEMKTLGETSRELASTEKTLGQAVRESAKAEEEKINAHRQVDKSAKESADEQIAQEKRTQQSIRSEIAKTAEDFAKANQQASAKASTINPWVTKAPEPRNENDAQAKASQESSLAEITKLEQESINAHRQVDKSAKQSADEQIAQSTRVSDTIAARMQSDMEKFGRVGIRTHKGYVDVEQMERDAAQASEVSQQWRQREIDAEKKQAETIGNIRGEAASPQTNPNEPQYLPNRATYNAAQRPLTEPGEENIARIEKARIKAEEEASQRALALREALAQRSAEIEEERTQQHEEATNTRTGNEEDGARAAIRAQQNLADSQDAANRQLPVLFQRIQSGALGSAAATARLGLNLAMLSASGTKDTEELAKTFVNLQAKIGLITETKQLFTGMSQTLQGLRQAGELTQDIVYSQQALGIATTFSQAATMRLAGAAASLQAAMGPVAAVATAIVGAYVAADMALKSMSDSEEIVAKRKEEHLHQYELQIQRVQDQLRGETVLLTGQAQILEQQWNWKKLLLGQRDMSAAELAKEDREKTAMQSAQSQQKVRDMAAAGFQDEAAKTKRKELVQQQQEATETLGDAQSSVATLERNSGGRKVPRATDANIDDLRFRQDIVSKTQVELFDAQRKKAEADAQLRQFDQSQGIPQLEAIAKGFTFDDQGHANLKGMMVALEALPGHMRDEGAKILSIAAEEQGKMFMDEQQRFGEMQSNLLQAPAKRDASESIIKREDTRFGEEQALADKFGSREGQAANKAALSALDRLDKAKATGNIDQQIQAAADAERALQESGLLSGDTKGLFVGDRTDTKRVRESLKDDASIDESEIAKNKETLDKAKVDLQDAQNALKEFPALIKAFKDKLDQMAEQSRQFQAALRNYSGT